MIDTILYMSKQRLREIKSLAQNCKAKKTTELGLKPKLLEPEILLLRKAKEEGQAPKEMGPTYVKLYGFREERK